MYIGYGVVYTIVVNFRSFVFVKYVMGIARADAEHKHQVHLNPFSNVRFEPIILEV